MNATIRPLDELVPQESNPRVQNPRRFAALVDSIRTHGVVDGAPCAYQPIIVNTHPQFSGQIVGGEMRWRAAREAGFDGIWAREVNLDADQLRDLTIRLNVPAGEWDWEKLEAQCGGEQLSVMGLEEFQTRNLQPRMVPVGELELDPENARHHKADSVKAIASSLERLGQQKPIVVQRGTNRVLAGNGTLLAARQLEWAEIAVVYSALEGDEARAFALADNRTAEVSGWELEQLSRQLAAFEASPNGIRGTDLGWEEHEIEPLIRADWTPPEVSEGADFATAKKKPSIAFTPEQRDRVAPALARARAALEDSASDAECLALICGEWLRAQAPVEALDAAREDAGATA